ncbi:unnamed protein product [Angiostrongylus costaricensis]|uniref:DUF2642 domain-containing protein n=1 Tax=Angiostrongylus costaricensis TaxID=334426 RepID=A0A0R3PXC0_ANGCS|nr:unnamed protein product [Angiostrongylus costaricensis]
MTERSAPSRRQFGRLDSDATQLVAVFVIYILSIVFASPTDRLQPNESVDLIVSHGRQTEQRLFGSFSPTGLNYEVQGDVVQVDLVIITSYVAFLRVK